MPTLHEPRADAPSPVDDDLRWLRSLARRLAKDADEADDLVQETWLHAERSEVDARSQRAWLGGVLRNRERMYRRAEARRRMREARAAEQPPGPDPDLELHRQRVLSVMREALDELDESDRQLLLARYCDEHPAATLAQRLGIPASTVRSRLSRATARVRQTLDERWGDRGAWAPAVAALPLPERTASSASSGWRAIAMAVVGKKSMLVVLAVLVMAGVSWGVMRGLAADADAGASEAEPAT
ncbi:MAG: sigma-70 family RNA polymerase sigma factor, partial [Myxococcales bacterium]|nr:sigma-70 family RNA polymerase sigma factor [Myxococcales bacterium]